MEKRKFADIAILNHIKMLDYRIEAQEEYNLLVIGDRGYPHYYRVEITFIGVEYIACTFHIEDNYTWRLASSEETKAVVRAFSDGDELIIVYCIEEDLSGYHHPPQREAHKFFIAAHAVEVIVYYDANNPNHLLALGPG